MGTLIEQKPRDCRMVQKQDVMIMVDYIRSLERKTDMSYLEMVETLKLMEMERTNRLYIDNADIFDEQMAGIGLLLQNLQTVQ